MRKVWYHKILIPNNLGFMVLTLVPFKKCYVSSTLPKVCFTKADTLYIGDNLWRDDTKCGPDYPLEDGSPAQCDPNHQDGYTCCSIYGWCGNSVAHCTCHGCIDYSQGKF